MTEELTLEKMRIVERLTTLEVSLERLIELKQHERDDAFRMHEQNLAKLTKIDGTLHGNGKDGLVVDMVKANQAIVLLIWAQGLTWATIVAWAIKTALHG